MVFSFRSKASGCFLLTNFMTILLLESLLYQETGKRWQFPNWNRGKCLLLILPDYFLVYHWNTRQFHVITTAVLLGLCLTFLRLMICSSSFVFTFFTTTSSLLIVSFAEYSCVSFSFYISLQRLDMSEYMITFSFKAIIFCTGSGFLIVVIADSDKVNKLVLSPIFV